MSKSSQPGTSATSENGFPNGLVASTPIEEAVRNGRGLVGSSIEGLQLSEFFLVLSSTGLAYRRCRLAWVNGDQIGVTFLRHRGKKSGGRRDARDHYVS